MKAILETEDLVKYYGEGENQVRAIDHTSMQVQHGEFVAVVGRSGSGKSTLLHMLGGLDRPDSGKVYIEGRDIFDLKDEQLAVFRRRKIGFIFQDYNLMPALNVWENIVLPIGLDGEESEERFCLGYSEKYRNGRTSSCYAESTIRRTEAACGYRTRPCSPSGNYFG